MEFIATSTTTIMSMFTQIIDTITGTPILALLFVGGTVLPIGFAIFKKFKRAS